jgi:aldehyde dehydrogenase (NAD+)
VLTASTFRTVDEAVSLANNSRYGLASSVWSETVNQALHVAARLKAGVVWINCANMFDAAVGFGGYRESGFGREGGREGLYEYLVPGWEKDAPALKPVAAAPLAAVPLGGDHDLPSIDRTAKLYVGGKQARPDGGYSTSVLDPKGRALGQVGLGNRKDIRNAVEAAHKATGWSSLAGHNRAQVLYFLAENLAARSEEFARRLTAADLLLRRLRRQI